MTEDLKNLNPQIRTVEIGVRNLRNIKIYPMSIADQTKFISLIEDVLNSYFEHTQGEALTEGKLPLFIRSLTTILGRNIEKLIELVLDPDEVTPDEFFKSVSNLQMSKILALIIEDNFEDPAKNVIGLTSRLKGLFQLMRPSHSSLNDTLNTDSKIFSENPSEKED